MSLTVPCCPLPCFLIGLKTVLPLKRRVSGLFLWLRCVSLWSSVPTECFLVPTCPHWGPCMLCCTMPSPSFSFCLQRLLALPLPQFSPLSCLIFVLVTQDTEVHSGWWQFWGSLGRNIGHHLVSYAAALGFVAHEEPHELHFLLCALWASWGHLSGFESKYLCQVLRFRAGEIFYCAIKTFLDDVLLSYEEHCWITWCFDLCQCHVPLLAHLCTSIFPPATWQ